MLIIDIYGQTLLHWAVAHQHYEAADALIKKMNRDEILLGTHANKYTVLHLAAQNGSIQIMELLLKNGQQELASKVDKFGQTALHWAASQGDFSACTMLCQYMDPPNINKITLKGETACDLAQANGFLDIAALLKINITESFSVR